MYFAVYQGWLLVCSALHQKLEEGLIGRLVVCGNVVQPVELGAFTFCNICTATSWNRNVDSLWIRTIQKCKNYVATIVEETNVTDLFPVYTVHTVLL